MKIQDLPSKEAIRIVPLLRDLHALHVQEQPKRFLASPTEQELELWLQDWLSQPKTHAIAAESPQGAIMGYTIFVEENRPWLPVRAQETRLMIHHLAVHSPFQRMGVGTALITEARKRAISLDVSSIGTSYAPFNAASAALFSRLGLEPVLTFAEWRP